MGDRNIRIEEVVCVIKVGDDVTTCGGGGERSGEIRHVEIFVRVTHLD